MIFLFSAIYASNPFSDQTLLFANSNKSSQQEERVVKNQEELRKKFLRLFEESGRANEALGEMTKTNQDLSQELDKLTAEKEKYTAWIPKLKKRMHDKAAQDSRFFFFGKREACEIDFSQEKEQHFNLHATVKMSDDQDLSGFGDGDEEGQFSPSNGESFLKIGTLDDSDSQSEEKEKDILLEIENAKTSDLIRDLKSKWFIFYQNLAGQYQILSQEEAKREDLINQIKDGKILVEQLKLTADRLERVYKKLLGAAWRQATFCEELKKEMSDIQGDFDRIVNSYRAPIGKSLSAKSEEILQKLKLDLALSQTQRANSESHLSFQAF